MSDSKETIVNVPVQAQIRLAQLQYQKQMAQMAFNQYTQGMIDSMELKGDWNLDISTMTLRNVTPVEEGD